MERTRFENTGTKETGSNLRFVFVIGLVLSAVSIVSAQYPLKIIAYHNQPIPGLDGLEFANFDYPPVINGSGAAAFGAGIFDPEFQQGGGDAIFSTRGPLHIIADEGEPAADLPGAVYDSLGLRLVIDDEGYVAFPATAQLASTEITQGFWAEGSGGLRLVARTGMQPPGLGPQYFFESYPLPDGGSFLTTVGYVFNGGRGAFLAVANDDDPGTSLKPDGVWSEGPVTEPLDLRAAAVYDGTTMYDNMGIPVINGLGETAFRTEIEVSASVWRTGVVAETGASLEIIAVFGDEAGVDDHTFTNFGDPLYNDNRELIFRGFMSNFDGGFWRTAGDEVLPVLLKDQTAPGTDLDDNGSDDLVFGPFFDDTAIINGQGHIAVNVSTSGSGPTRRGIWALRSSGNEPNLLEKVAMTGDPAPGFDNGFFLIYSGHLPVMNIHGDIAFYAGVRDDQGTGIANAIFVQKDGVLELAARTGQMIDLPNGVSFEVGELNFAGGSGNQDGRPSGFGDNGDLIFRADKALGGTSTIDGIFVASIYADGTPGDVNEDGSVNGKDFSILGEQWLLQACGDCSGADQDNDNDVDSDDLYVIAANWLTFYSKAGD